MNENLPHPINVPLDGFPNRYDSTDFPTTGPHYNASGRANAMLQKGGIVALYGPRGTGKTFMALDLASNGHYRDPWYPRENVCHRPKPRPAIYRTAMEIFLQIRDTWRKGSELSELQLIASFADAVLLVIDEVQERGENDFENQKLTAIIDARYRQQRPTLMIGNYRTKEEFAASISPSIVSRIQEDGGAIHCNWPSFRSNKP